MRHMSGAVWAVFDKPVRMYRGNTMAGCIKDERYHTPRREFVGGYYMQTLHLGLSFFAARLANNLDFGRWGLEYARTMEAYEYMAGMWLVGEDMPQAANRVTLHPSEKISSACRFRTFILMIMKTTLRCVTTLTSAAPWSTMPWVRPASFGTHRARQRIISAPVVRVADLRMGFATSGGKLTISKTYSFRTAASSQPVQRKVRP